MYHFEQYGDTVCVTLRDMKTFYYFEGYGDNLSL